ncbi:MAG: ABC transporter substrate-binding protein [Acidimicrobiales bacterium]|jgi:peptide/nickel transport system substrate-binding protein|nr:ABC transporter substrate-binding protein [Acidimicrobiales bacterium]
MPPRTRSHRGGVAAAALALLVTMTLLGSACGSGDDEPEGASGGPDGTGEGLVEAENANAPADDDGTPQPGGTLRFAIEGDADGYGPTNNLSIGAQYVASSIYDPLVAPDENGELQGRLAESVEPNDDATVWTITAREGITFHDGTPFDAAAIKKNIDTRLANPINAQALALIEEAVVIDDRTVEVRMEAPWAGYEYTLTASGGYMAAPSAIDDPDGSSNPVGTGAFRLVEWLPNDSVVVERNEDYWRTDADGNALPYLDGIEFRIIEDDSARANALQAGDIDLMINENPLDVAEFRTAEGYVQAEDFDSEERFLMMNSDKAPFDNRNARFAVITATDRALILSTLTDDLALPVDQPFAPNQPYHTDDPMYPDFDVEAARGYVEAYEQETGQELAFTYFTEPGPNATDLAQLLKEQWEAAGMKVTLQSSEQAAFLSQVFLGNYQISSFRNYGYTDPDFNYIFWHSSFAAGAGNLSINFTQMRSPELDAALDEGRGDLDPEVRAAAYQQATQAINTYGSHVWLYEVPWAMTGTDSVKGLSNAEVYGFGRIDSKPWVVELWLGD